ncbi:MAG: indole-3-glycerol phosphate synthase TrpC [Bryobacteraceae bacterium]
MPPDIPDILARIVAVKRQEVRVKLLQRKALESTAEAQRGQRRPFRQALVEGHLAPHALPAEAMRRLAIIAEIKKASPSKGLLCDNFNPTRHAMDYFAGGASALSVLTDKEFFQGSLGDLKTARACAALPVLRKDFTIDEIDVVESAASGADAILLIAALLTAGQIHRFQALADEYAMDSLVEVHDREELDKALSAGARIIGVNNRDLRTFTVSLETAESLAPHIPADVVKVAESGIHSRADIDRLTACGFQAFLVGEHLMTAPDVHAALRAIIGRDD